MFSIHKSTVCLAAATLGLAALSGCTAPSRSNVVAVNVEPIAPDAAMQYRDWPRATAYYSNGAVTAGATRFIFQAPDDTQPRLQQVAELPLFVANTILVPVTYFIVPPFEPVVYRGAVTPPTYNANPVLPAPAPSVTHP